MRLLLDTADLAEIGWANGIGLIDGVTTNPSQLAEAAPPDGRLPDQLARICSAVRGPVYAPVVAVDAEGIYREGRDLARISDQIIAEIPMLEDGLIATRRLAAEGVRVSITLVFSAAQALLAARAGAVAVTPFVGRLDDVGGDGLAVVAQIRDIFRVHATECDIIASSLRTPRRVADVAALGVDAAAVPPRVMRTLLLHPLTDRGVDQFLSDWSKRPSARLHGA